MRAAARSRPSFLSHRFPPNTISTMVDEKYLEILRCPVDPKREAKLAFDDTRVVCSRCRVQFRNREGFLSLVVEEVTLPEGCAAIEDLACRQDDEMKKGNTP